MADPNSATIAALATPIGRGSVGIVRVSGALTRRIAEAVLGCAPPNRLARYGPFLDEAGVGIDEGIALYFEGPASFTGEDVLELHGHGGPVVMDLLLQRVLGLGARLADPGEFSRRAFLNDKLDLAQAEAIADLIDSQTRAAARAAVRSLSGEFSAQVNHRVEQITRLRTYVEAAIDFPEEEIDFLTDSHVGDELASLIAGLEDLLGRAINGRLMRDGMTLVIAGRPNAGKSSLMNALTGADSAIVTHIPGTTRDVLRERIEIDGLPIHVIDTAGLRDSGDAVELEGVRRARDEITRADHALWVYDGSKQACPHGLEDAGLPENLSLTLVRNKVDIGDGIPGQNTEVRPMEISLSAKTGEGLDLLREHLKQQVAFTGATEGDFSARRRHLDALRRALDHCRQGRDVLETGSAGELLAEDLRQAQRALSEITGEFSADDLLGEIFSSFCIGK